MKITISQQNKRLSVVFKDGKVVGKYTIDKAEELLVCIDKLIRKHQTVKISSWRNVKLEFHDTGFLTERVAVAIMLGLSF